ncbi:MAG: LPS export ABC transporter permease LptF [Proteobacteria bacterium]|jgi:lipopolysaccharide export system permease protein|nr:LPS export ABC transporter permease LptF [Pseudomonadota bacterium]MBT6464183.1 LPS export ABC transporter permease LptF [Pseudomonadota bacterium]MBT7245775.1 LPS export ABC transporter permease LptF [Pseudomonadota bacterium]
MILHKHVLTEIIKTSSAILVGLLVIFLSMRLATYFADAASGNLASQYVLKIVALKMLVSIQDLVPISMFLGSYTVVTSLQKHSELVSMKANGMSHLNMLFAVAKLSGIAALLVAVMTCIVNPMAELKLVELKYIGERTATIANVAPGVFKKISGGDKVFFAKSEATDKTFLEHVFVHDDTQPFDAAMVAERSFILNNPDTGGKTAIFEKGTSYQGRPGTLGYVITNFKRYSVKIKSSGMSDVSTYPTYVATPELIGSKGPYYAAELQWRLALPIFAFIAPLIALLIALKQKRGSWYLGFATALGVYFTYLNALGIFKAMIKKQEISAVLGFASAHLLFGLLLLLLYLDLENRLRFKKNIT